MKKVTYSLILALLIMSVCLTNADAKSSYQTSFRSTYPAAVGSTIDTCNICHPGGNTGSLNSYANAYANAGHSFTAIASQDSDGDTYTNITEINAKTFPGDATSKPTTTPVNRPPVANAGADKTVTSGSSVILAGTGSDPDAGDTLTYTWSQIGTPAVTLANANSSSASFTAPTVQSSTSLTFQLLVRDRAGATATDTCIVTVNRSGVPTGAPPVADAGVDQNVLPGTLNTLSGFYSSDADGGIVSYAWTQTGGPAVTLSDATAMTPVFQAPASATTLTFRLVVTDKSGLQDDDTCTVVVLSATGGGTTSPPAGNQPPVARAGSDQSVRSGTTVRLSGSGSTDPDDGIASYGWRQISGTSVSLSGASSANASFRAPGVGSRGATLTFELTVRDRAGLSSSDTVSINVSGSSKDD